MYKSQGITIHDKHIEVIVRQMLRKRRVKDSGDTELMPGKSGGYFDARSDQRRCGRRWWPARDGRLRVAGNHRSGAGNTESFLSAASFQKTTKVLTEAATHGKDDTLEGLKENVIIGRLIPAGTGLQRKRSIKTHLDEDSVEYAKTHLDELGASEFRPRPREASLDTADLFLPEAIVEDASALEAAGLSVVEGEQIDAALTDDFEPAADDLVEDDLIGDDALGGLLGSDDE